MRGSLRLGRIAGIEVRVHYTWIFIFALVVWSLAYNFFPYRYPGWNLATYWITAVVAVLFLFACVLLHELAHSLVAQARGLLVRSITLFIFGGVSNLSEEPERPAVEFSMTIVGPLTSLALAGIFWGLLQLVPNRESPLAAMLDYLALINLILGLFNLIPGFPLDGGRVLRSILWATSGDLIKATNIAALVGYFFGWGLIAFGIFQLFTGNFLGGIWMAFIGWFLSNAATASRRQTTLQGHLTNIMVKEVMDPNPEAITPGLSVAEMVRDFFLQQRHRALPVSLNDQLLGIVSITDVKEVPQHKWAETTVGEIMSREPIYSVAPADGLNSAMRLLTRHDLNQVLVLEEGRLVGILSRADVICYLQLSQELGMKPGRGIKQGLSRFLFPR